MTPGSRARRPPTPSGTPHRTGTAWTLRTVASILANPRYTGRQVWNRQRTDHDVVDPILQAGSSSCLRGTKQAIVQVTSPSRAAELIDRLRADDITLIYDPATRTLRTGTKDSLAVSIG